jgi:hypothetical protein
MDAPNISALQLFDDEHTPWRVDVGDSLVIAQSAWPQGERGATLNGWDHSGIYDAGEWRNRCAQAALIRRRCAINEL